MSCAKNFGSYKQNILGPSLIGQTEAFTQDNNDLTMLGFAIIIGFINHGITKNLFVNLSANNIFDSLGITEAEEGSIVEN